MKILSNRGFTLVEVLVVVAIIAVLLIIGMPALLNQVQHNRLTRSARDVLTELNVARLKAISENKLYRMEFTQDTPDKFQTAFTTDPSDPMAWQADPSRAQRSVAAGVDIVSPVGDFNVQFKPSGTATAVQICLQNSADATDSMKVEVYGPTGRVEISSGC